METTTTITTPEQFGNLLSTTMNPDANKLSFSGFKQKLQKYCSNSEECAAQEKEIVARFKEVLSQRDACLGQLVRDKKSYILHSEDVLDLQHQHEAAIELLEAVEKKCNLLALEQLSLDDDDHPRKQDAIDQNTPENMETISNIIPHITEQRLNIMLRKYCNIYTQFDQKTKHVRLLSLTDNRYLEFSLNENNTAELREQIWTYLSACSAHLDSWEKLL